MSPSRIIITGTISSGKSTLSALLREMGYKVIDSDLINRKLLEKGGKNYQAIKEAQEFKEAFHGDILDKKALAELIFSDKDKMKKLNKISHKNILEAIDREVEACQDDFVFIEVPLFFSMEEKMDYDHVRLVDAERNIQIDRLIKRDEISYDYAIRKLESQENREKMLSGSDLVFDNSRDIEHLRSQLIKNLKLLEKENEDSKKHL